MDFRLLDEDLQEKLRVIKTEVKVNRPRQQSIQSSRPNTVYTASQHSQPTQHSQPNPSLSTQPANPTQPTRISKR